MSKYLSRPQSVLLFAGLLGAASLLVIGCHEMSNPAAPPMPETQNLQPVTGSASQGQTAVCHQGDLGPETLWVSPNAVPAHLAHGDTAGECGAVAQCPCYADLAAAGFTSQSLCFDTATQVNIFQPGDQAVTLSSTTRTCELVVDGVQVEFYSGLSAEVWNACSDILRAEITTRGMTCF